MLNRANVVNKRLTYKAPPLNHQESWCELHFFKSNASRSSLLMLTDRINAGVSITNSIEYAIPAAIGYVEAELKESIPQDCLFVEHYDQKSYHTPSEGEENFALVTLEPNNSPAWEHIPVKIAISLLKEISQIGEDSSPQNRPDNLSAIELLESFSTEGDEQGSASAQTAP